MNLDCGCHADGTLNNGLIETCNITTGVCDCEVGYTNDKCNECSAGYFNDGSNSSAPMCTGKYLICTSNTSNEVVYHFYLP